MSYLVIVATLVIALTGLLSETIQKDAHGNKVRSAWGTYKPTFTGYFFIVLLVFSSAINIWEVVAQSRNARTERDALQERIERLQDPFLRDIRVSVSLRVSGSAAAEFVARLRRVKGPTQEIMIGRDLWPRCNVPNEEGLCEALFGTDVRIYFFPKEVSLPEVAREGDLMQFFSSKSVLGLLCLGVSPVSGLPPAEAGKHWMGCELGTERYTLFSYTQPKDRLELEVRNIIPTFLQDKATFTSMRDFRSALVLVYVSDPSHEIPVELSHITLTTPTHRKLDLEDFQRVALPDPRTGNYFLARISEKGWN